jgi:hypothetical protein
MFHDRTASAPAQCDSSRLISTSWDPSALLRLSLSFTMLTMAHFDPVDCSVTLDEDVSVISSSTTSTCAGVLGEAAPDGSLYPQPLMIRIGFCGGDHDMPDSCFAMASKPLADRADDRPRRVLAGGVPGGETEEKATLAPLAAEDAGAT